MKKLILSGLCALLATGAFAQVQQGNIAISGGLNINSIAQGESNYESKNTNVNIYPTVSYFVKDGLSVGIATGFGFGTSRYENSENNYKSKDRFFNYNVGLDVTKYISITEKLYFTASGETGYRHSRTRGTEPQDRLTNKSSGFYISVTPGLTYFATPRLGLTASIGNISYDTSRSKSFTETSTIKSNSDQFSFSLSPGTTVLGVSYFINR